MRIALVGPTGVLGRALVPLLLEAGHTVRALARSPGKARELFPQVSEVEACDLLAISTDSLARQLDGCEVVAHIATAIPADFNAPNAWEANSRLRTEGVRKLLDAALAAGVRRYVQQSITMAYPDGGEEWITEEVPLLDTPHNAPVLKMEQMVREAPAGRLEWCILRGSMFVGPGTFQVGTIERLRAGTLKVGCEGRPWSSFIHAADMASAVAAACERAPAGAIFNVTAEPVRHGDYLDRVARAMGAPLPARDPEAECPPSWRCSNRAITEALGWRPEHPIVPESA